MLGLTLVICIVSKSNPDTMGNATMGQPGQQCFSLTDLVHGSRIQGFLASLCLPCALPPGQCANGQYKKHIRFEVLRLKHAEVSPRDGGNSILSKPSLHTVSYHTCV